MKAYLHNYRQAPRKVRLVAGLIKGKHVDVAMLELKHLAKRAALPIEKLLASAIANAKVGGADVANLMVKDVQVDKGIVMKRHMPRAFGRASAIHKHSSHVTLVLAEVGASKKAAHKQAKADKADNTAAAKETKAKKAPAKKVTKAKAVKK